MYWFLVFLSLFIIELLYFKIADKYNIIDKPNERSSHSEITLRGGGVIFYFAVLLFFILNKGEYYYFFIGLTLITGISFLDDVFTLSNKIRLSVQLISVILLLVQLQLIQQPYIWAIIAVVLCIGIVNAYNFMDGINGITAAYSLIVLLLLTITNSYIPFINQELISFTILGALVFAFFNFRNKAKCFAGDVGSVAMAFIVVFLIAKLIITTQNPIFILFLLVYGTDTVWTIIKRLLNKENIFQAHRTHLYQYLVNEAKYNKLIIATTYALVQFAIGGIVIYSVLNTTPKTQTIIAIFLIAFISVIYTIGKHKLLKRIKKRV